MMLNRKRRMKLVALMASGAMVLQFGGCLGNIWQQAGIGFGRQLGADQAGAVSAALGLDDLLGGLTDLLPAGG